MTIWTPNLSSYQGPRYRAIADAIATDIQAGELKPGTRLPTHRSLADALGVTVGTVTRGYQEAERRELVEGRIGAGTYVKVPDAEPSYGLNIEHDLSQESGMIDMSLSLAISSSTEGDAAQMLQEIAAAPERLRSLLQYQPETGLAEHKAFAADWVGRFGIEALPDEMAITSGGQHAIAISLQALTQPGDVVLTENLTYPGLLAAARLQHLKVVGFRADIEGYDMDQLESLMQKHAPRVLYTVSSLHNPTTHTLPLQQRYQLIELAKRYDVMLIEDDVQSFMLAPRLPALASLAPQQVVHISSVSKAITGGLRIGFIRMPEAQKRMIGHTIRASCWMAPPLMAELAMRWYRSGRAEQLISWQEAQLRQRFDCLAQHLSGFHYFAHPHCFHVWLLLPEGWRATAFSRRLRDRGVIVKPSEVFAVPGISAPEAVRVCISSPSSQAQLEAGLRLIRQTLDEGPDLELSIM